MGTSNAIRLGRALDEMRRLAAGYQPPPDACESFRELYDSLRRLEDDLHAHIHLENYVLFPRSIELEPLE